MSVFSETQEVDDAIAKFYFCDKETSLSCDNRVIISRVISFTQSNDETKFSITYRKFYENYTVCVKSMKFVFLL